MQAGRTTPAGDFDYDQFGRGYSQLRRTEPRIAAMVHAALGNARTVVNVGAGAGSYEPRDRYVVAIEPSAAMRAQRPREIAPAIDGVAERLPLDDGSVDAAMSTLSVHQWQDWRRGLRELRRVSRGPVVVMTFDGDEINRFWLAEYCPEVIAAEHGRFPPIAEIAAVLGGRTRVQKVPIPIDCVDGFTEAYYARPAAFLDARVRGSQSAWGFVSAEVQERFVRELTAEIENGEWERKHGHLRSEPVFWGALRLIVSEPWGAHPKHRDEDISVAWASPGSSAQQGPPPRTRKNDSMS
ncbi:MAG TPA: methyltransferase domain-containing protein [Phycisphaerales bacterium]|nr:methyltransferase domain-containing protein [Phycisphaerales bacterium]